MIEGTGKSKNGSYNPLMWVVFLLQTIGRGTYKFMFFILKIIYLTALNVVNFFKNIFLNINLSFVKKKISEKKKIIKEKKSVIPVSYFGFLKKFYFVIFPVLRSLERLSQKINSVRFVIFLKKIFSKNKKINSGKRARIKTALKISFLVMGLILLVFSGFFYYVVLKDLPNPNELLTREQALTTKILASDGTLLYKIYRNQSRSLIRLEDIPKYVIDATVACEDKEFWEHPGFSLVGIIRAFKKNILNESDTQGGSTITQQLIKNALLSSEKTYIRKLKELVLAIEVELIFDKKEILQMYFNEIPYGGVSYGIVEAAETYFGKKVNELTLSEAALLAGIPTAPTRYSPYGAHPEYALYRQHHVLNRMVEDGYISLEEAKRAKTEKMVLKSPTSYIKAPHFVMYVKDLLVQKYGSRMVEEGGLEVWTSLNPTIQELAEKSVKDEIEKLYSMHVTNGSVLVTAPNTGEVLAMVGSRDYFDKEHDGNVNITTALRQPGSSIKPVTYALAFQSGMNPSTVILDAPVVYPDGSKTYAPVNYDGKFHGNVTLRTALGSSFNIPAVKLLDKLGVENLIDFGTKMGITTWYEKNRFGLSLTLGGGEVKMTDMAETYGVFANGGLKVKLHPILTVKDEKGKELDDFYCNPGFNFFESIKAKDKKTFCQPKAVLAPTVAYQISDVLSDNNARIPGFGTNSLLNIANHQVAVKTGTTNDKRDNWTIGYTPSYVVVTWVGNNDNTPMSAVASGITGATPIWHNTMKGILEGKENEGFTPPSGLIPVQICADNGLLPCTSCRNLKIEYFVPGTEPKVACVDATPSPSPKLE